MPTESPQNEREVKDVAEAEGRVVEGRPDGHQRVSDPSRRRSSRRRWFRVIAAAVGVLLGLVVCELALRVYVASRGWTPNCYVGSIQLLVPHQKNGYTLAPHHQFRSSVYDIAINSLGLRGPEVSRDKPLGVTRIAILGGSSVFGYLVGNGEEASRYLERQLRREGKSVEVINAGVPGYNLFQTTERYRETIAPLKPDVVVIYLGWNDLRYIISETPDTDAFRRGYCAPRWERILSYSVSYGFIFHRLLARAANFNPPSTAGTITKQGKQQFLANLNALRSQVGSVPLFVCSQATLANPEVLTLEDEEMIAHLGADISHAKRTAELGKELHNMLQEFANSNGLPFIDAYGELRPNLDILGDAIHLTAKGEQELGRLLAERLVDQVSD